MGKNNRCKKRKAAFKDFRLTPLEVAQAKTELDQAIREEAERIAQYHIRDAGFIFALMHVYILCKTFRFSGSMIERFMGARIELVGGIRDDDDSSREALETMYAEVEKAVGVEAMTRWFAKEPTPEIEKL